MISHELREYLEARGFEVVPVGSGTLVVDKLRLGFMHDEPITFELVEQLQVDEGFDYSGRDEELEGALA